MMQTTRFFALLLITLLASVSVAAETPANLVAENVPSFPADLAEKVAPYMEARSAGFSSWHPQRREMLISTRFGDVPQIHLVKMPGGARRQMTFFADRVGGGSFNPANGDMILFSKDVGGGEFFQLYRFDVPTGKITLLTDGTSRNTGASWSNRGDRVAWSSTRRTGRDSDVWIMNPAKPEEATMLLELEGGGWFAGDWSPDDKTLLLGQYISANESYIHLVDVAAGEKKLLTPRGETKILYSNARFARDGRSIYVVSDEAGEFSQLFQWNLGTGAKRSLSSHIEWDVSDIELSDDGKYLAFTTNEAGVGVLRVLDLATGREIALPKLPLGTIGGIEFHANGKDLAFTLTSAKSPTDVFSVDVTTGKLERWTESETGGLDTSLNVEPELVRMKSFDGLEISGFLYRPDPAKFSGKRPVIVNIHGGPEGQARPGFLARNNYLINELGIAIFYPNVRGSSGYGKTFLALDNGYKREDSVRDIGTVLDFIAADGRLDESRIGVTGGSYGGYMTLAVSTHYADRIRAALDVVGISNFVTFLENTQGYRRDLRRAEYGDERDEKMREFLHAISPLTNVAKIRKPLFVVQGFNDPRVPWTEAEQIVKAVRESGIPVWYLMAKDEGHGFAKKQNADYQFLASILFWEEHLLERD
jgi:dipeptidyl aminopeptidase/acylaminoacyl peptidase